MFLRNPAVSRWFISQYHYLECFLVIRSYQLQDFATNRSIDVDVG